MSKENLHFEIGLSGTHWGKLPQFTILVDDQVVKTGSADEHEIHVFDVELEEGRHALKIRLENKEDSDTVQAADNRTIIKDLLLNINSLGIDNIEISNLRWSKSRYELDKPAEIEPGVFKSEYDNCADLGHNGTWIFEFDSPFYIWLLENI
jgi:hypothetical protein